MTKRFKALLAVSLICGAAPAFSAEKTPTYPLDQIVPLTEKAIDEYQSNAGPAELPRLASAEFDFKTVTTTPVGGGISFLVFTLQASHQKQSTNDITFVYKPEPKRSGLAAANFKSFYQELLDTMTAAAKAITAASDTPSASAPPKTRLDFCELQITISFGVTTDIKGGVSVPFQFVTVSGNLERSNNNVQQVKLTFEQPDATKAACAAKP